jgi:hypothetical protein
MASDSEDQTPWIPDEHVNACSVCHVEFTVYNRRHHCRACGNVVCGACSSHRIELKSGGVKQRVCDRCEVNFTEQGLTAAEQLNAQKDMTARLKTSIKQRQHELSEFNTFLRPQGLDPQQTDLTVSVQASVQELLTLRAQLDQERGLLFAAERDARVLARRTIAAEAEAKKANDLVKDISEFETLANQQDLLIDKLRERIARTESFSNAGSSAGGLVRSDDPRVSILTHGRPEDGTCLRCCTIS